jgi:hypothetical protein
MKRIILKILNSIKDFFNKMSDQEAKRVIDFYNHLFASEFDERRWDVV